MSKRKNKSFVFKLFRWLHVYSSTALFTLLVYFSITGIFLNHRWYDESNNVLSEQEFSLSSAQLKSWGLEEGVNYSPDLSAIGRYLQAEFNLPVALSVDLDDQAGDVIFEYKVPAGFASAWVISKDKVLIIETESGSSVGVLNDLHKGRHSGGVWFWLIDISAVLMVLFSITGMVILFHGKKYRRSGVICSIAGAITPICVYFLAVPRI